MWGKKLIALFKKYEKDFVENHVIDPEILELEREIQQEEYEAHWECARHSRDLYGAY